MYINLNIIHSIEQKGVSDMAQTNINIRMDAELKRQFEEFCADVGMSMTTAFTVFAKKNRAGKPDSLLRGPGDSQ